MKRPVITTLLVAAIVAANFAAAAVINVPGDYAQIHDAVQAANAGDTVMVAAGTYTDCTHETEGPGTTPACVIMKSGVTLIGAGPENTIIDAEGLGRGIFIEDTDDVRIENLQIRGAYAEVFGAGILIRGGSTGAEVRDCIVRDTGDGGVIVITDSEAMLTRVDFLYNLAKQGGGLSVEENSTAVVTDCLFEGNSTPGGGGGIFVTSGANLTLTGSTLTNNLTNGSGTYGGGVGVENSNADISGCEFTGNTSAGNGGGLAFDGATGSVQDCVFEGNSTVGNYFNGGGISCSGSAIAFSNLLVANNNATSVGSNGGGIDIQFTPSPTIEHCTFIGNASAGDPDADPPIAAATIFVQWFAAAQITNCLITDSVGGAAVGCAFSGVPVVTGCNLWQNGGGDTFCGTDGGCNFSADPLYCNADEGNYRIGLDSPCAQGNHPDGGACGDSYVGAYTAGCGNAVGDTPVAARLLGNSPNPFNPLTTIHFVLDAPGDAVVRIHDVRGRTIRSFRRASLAAHTRYEIDWNGCDQNGRSVPSGVYLYELDSRGTTTTKRMSLIR